MTLYREYAVKCHPGLAGKVKDSHHILRCHIFALKLRVDHVIELILELTEGLHIGTCAFENIFPANVAIVVSDEGEFFQALRSGFQVQIMQAVLTDVKTPEIRKVLLNEDNESKQKHVGNIWGY